MATTADKRPTDFGIGIGEIFVKGFEGYRRAFGPLTLAGLITIGVYAIFRVPANNLYIDDRVFTSIGVDLIGLLVSGTIAHAWFRLALAAADGEPITLSEAFSRKRSFYHQAVASFWFWAGVLLGLRYLLGIPSIVAVLFYAFFGYVIADGRARGGMDALGTSVRVGHRRRIGLFAIASLLTIVNMVGLLPLGFGDSPLAMVGAVIGFAITSSISLIAGAVVYRALSAQITLPERVQ